VFSGIKKLLVHSSGTTFSACLCVLCALAVRKVSDLAMKAISPKTGTIPLYT
jgi:hypothetical protein